MDTHLHIYICIQKKFYVCVNIQAIDYSIDFIFWSFDSMALPICG